MKKGEKTLIIKDIDSRTEKEPGENMVYGRRKTMKKFIKEFKAFALRGNVMDMAVGVLIASAFSGIVTSLTDNFINPIISLVTGAATYSLQDIAGFASNFVAAVVNFVIMAFILFLLLKGVNKVISLGHKKEEPAAPDTKICPYCLSKIPAKAVRCAYCTSVLEENAGTAEDTSGVLS